MQISNDIIIEKANSLGFDLVGFSPAGELKDEFELLKDWLNRGFNAGMKYMERNSEKKRDVKNLLPSAESVISLGMNYYTPQSHLNDRKLGKVSRYAWSKDYHLIIREKLDILINELQKIDPFFEAKSYVDTGPIMDKAWAVKGGLGWIGKHTNVINKEIGSWFFIANILTNYKFDYSLPVNDFCGSCTACIEACPTDAIVDEYVLNANKCISYLTIENKNEIPEEFKGKFDNWIFGCDVCQDVCPWNIKFSKTTEQKEFFPINNKEMPLDKISSLTEEEFKERFKESPIKRTKLSGLKRNASFIRIFETA